MASPLHLLKRSIASSLLLLIGIIAGAGAGRMFGTPSLTRAAVDPVTGAGQLGPATQESDADRASDTSALAAAANFWKVLVVNQFETVRPLQDTPFLWYTLGGYKTATSDAERDEQTRAMLLQNHVWVCKVSYSSNARVITPDEFFDDYAEEVQAMQFPNLRTELAKLKLTTADRMVIDPDQGSLIIVRPGPMGGWHVAGIAFFGFKAQSSPGDLTRDVIYGRKFGVALTLDILKPKRARNHAAVIDIISDGYVSGKLRNADYSAGQFTDLLNNGYTLIVVTHSSVPRFCVSEAVADAHRAVRFVRFNARKLGIDPNRIAAMGSSAGGHLALMLGVADGNGPPFHPPGDLTIQPSEVDPVEAVSSRVQAVVAYFPPTDLLDFGVTGTSVLKHPVLSGRSGIFDVAEFASDRFAYRVLTDLTTVSRKLGELSPARLVTAKAAPTLLFHGSKDKNVPLQQSQTMADKLRAAGVPVDLVVMPDAGHGWSYGSNIVGVPNPERDRILRWLDTYLLQSKQ
jgi:acetyl esterase/lipase